jgi:two-component system, cell cycle sensor histidine kinase and response regulator CckA
MNILIVDDNEANRKLLRIIMQAEGHQIVEAIDGIDALEILRKQSFDAVISDILMPRMDGYRLCHEVRNTEALKDLLFIFYTSTFTTSPDERLALEMGADRFLRKPSPLREILQALEPVRENQRKSRSGPDENVAELNAMQGYSEVLVRKLEHRNSELQLTKEQLLRTNTELLSRSRELEAAKLRLELTANQLQSLFDNLDDVFFSVDIRERQIVQISPSCKRILGFPPQAFFSNPMLWKEITFPADRSQFAEAEADLSVGRSWQNETRIQRSSGEISWVQSKIKPFLDDTGALARIDGVISDISVRKQLEEQLRHSQKLEAVGRLAGGVAHDFNNLLTAILGYSELALNGLERGSELHQEIEEIKIAGERASSLTRQLLAFSRKQILDPKILDLNSVVSDVEMLLRRLIGEDILLTTILAPGVKPIRADRGQIEQVIVNLAVNARDAMPGGGRLTVETGDVELDETYVRGPARVPQGHYVMLVVSDTGTGMSREVQSHIFEPFFTTKEPGKGTGLGLATVYGIVKQSGGHIWVYSEPDKGTAFKIYLSPADRGERVTVAQTSGETRAPSRGGTILVAEDEEAVRKLIVRALRDRGYSVIEAADGEEALRVATQYRGRLDLLLTDTVMPGVSGPTLSEQLRIARPEVRVLYMSGYTGDAAVLNEILESGVAFLQKPFGPEVLAQKVSEVLTSKGK